MQCIKIYILRYLFYFVSEWALRTYLINDCYPTREQDQMIFLFISSSQLKRILYFPKTIYKKNSFTFFLSLNKDKLAIGAK